jgi:hypothetical protein
MNAVSNFFHRLAFRESTRWTHLWFPANKTDESSTTQPPINQRYLTIMLKAARVNYSRRGKWSLTSLVHCHAELPDPRLGHLTLDTVSLPKALAALDKARLHRVIARDLHLVGPVPIRSESIRFEIGVFSMREQDLLGQYVRLVERVSRLVGNGLLQVAQPWSKIVEDALDGITGSDSLLRLEIGLQTDLATAQTGMMVIVAKSADDADVVGLHLTLDGNLVDSTGASVRNSHVIFTVEHTTHRADWYTSPSLGEGYAQLMKAVEGGNRQKISGTLQELQRRLSGCLDLTASDAAEIRKTVEAELEERLPNALTSDSARSTLPEPENLMTQWA